MSVSIKDITFVPEKDNIALVYPPAPKVQSINLSPPLLENTTLLSGLTLQGNEENYLTMKYLSSILF